MRLAAAWATDVGRVRSGNEDSVLIDERLGVFAIADGMGGHRGGEVASSTAVEAVRSALAAGAAIDSAIRSANTAIRERAVGDPDVAGMGTTFTAVVPLDGSAVLVGHVGDSRAYLLRDGELRRLTQDHSLVEDLLREGQITADQAESHPQRSIITRALGIEPQIDVDLYTVQVVNGDRLLLCSDGLTDMLTDREIERTLAEESGGQVVDVLIDRANLAGGTDNVTVIVLDVLDVDLAPGLIDESPHEEVESTDLATTVGLQDELDSDREHHATGEPDAATATARRRWSWIRVVRVALVVVPLLAIATVAYLAIRTHANNTYFVGEDRGEVVIWRGVQGGVAGFEPEIAERTDLFLGTLVESEQLRVRNGYCEGSRETARTCVEALREGRVPTPETTVTTSGSVTTSVDDSAPSTAPPAAGPTTSPTPSSAAVVGP